MHTLNRIVTALILMIVLVPPATFALVSLDAKKEAQEELQEAIGAATNRYQQRTGLQSLKTKGERIVREQELKLHALNARKRALRMDIIKHRRILRTIGERYGITLASKEGVQTMISSQKRHLERLLKAQYLRGTQTASTDPRDVVVGVMFHAAAAQSDASVSQNIQVQMLKDLMAAQSVFWKLEALEMQRDEVLGQYNEADTQYQKAYDLITRSDEQLEHIKAIMDEVHDQVLKLQGELARIDARLKAKAERALIEKGLLDPASAGNNAPSPRPQFSWPVYGHVSAGFHNESYKKHFGVPHHGQDIVVGQDTPVKSAADGVVFLVRDGGAAGYSYILIGHRGGYATLYGHLAGFAVKAGDDVVAGQVIASSGGTPGTYGAGPMTTGAHLHFEVIKAGVNVDPMTVLP
jgi:murein DD-endopeptidase MepM/ murein hydrolase activator NlpD